MKKSAFILTVIATTLTTQAFAGECKLTDGVRSVVAKYYQIGASDLYLKDVLVKNSVTVEGADSLKECIEKAVVRAADNTFPRKYRSFSYVEWSYKGPGKVEHKSRGGSTESSDIILASGQVDNGTDVDNPYNLAKGDKRSLQEGKNIFPCAVYLVDGQGKDVETKQETITVPPAAKNMTGKVKTWSHVDYHLTTVADELPINESSISTSEQCQGFATSILNAAYKKSSDKVIQANYVIDDSILNNAKGVIPPTEAQLAQVPQQQVAEYFSALAALTAAQNYRRPDKITDK